MSAKGVAARRHTGRDLDGPLADALATAPVLRVFPEIWRA
jgi:hypothetical protein